MISVILPWRRVIFAIRFQCYTFFTIEMAAVDVVNKLPQKYLNVHFYINLVWFIPKA